MRVALYRGTRPGLQGVFNIVVRWWTRGPYSHCELILAEYPDGTVLCGSASHLDGGVRLKRMALCPSRWEIRRLPFGNPERARQWFEQRKGHGYDLLGVLGFVVRPIRGSRHRWFCSEAVLGAVGMREPWRFCPNTLAALCT